jgi:hypothetical protein
MDSYLSSSLRREKRGLLAAQLRLYQFKRAQRNKQTLDVRYLRCQLCDVKCQPESMQLHEIVARGLIGNKQALEYLPTEAHSLLCPYCNLNRADHQNARLVLWRYSVELWGKHQVRNAMQEFNNYLVSVGGTPLSPLVIDYELLESE